MNTLREFVEYKLTHSDKTSEVEGYPLTMENCKKNKIMKQLEVYGNSVQGDNLFDDLTTLITGYYLIDTGEQVSHSKWSTTDYIEVNGYTFTLTNVGASTPAICAYDENKNFIKGARYSTADSTIKRDVKIESDSLIKYLRFPIKNEWLSDGSLENIRLFHNPTPDIPAEIYSVGDLVTDETDANYNKYKIPVVSRGKNFIQFPYANMSVTHNGVTFTVNDDGTVTANGTAEGGTAYIIIQWWQSHQLPLGTYTMSCGATADVYMLTSGVFSGRTSASCRGDRTTTFTVDEESYQNNTTCCVYEGKTVNNVVFKPMIEKGTQATEFEKGVEPITTNVFLDEPLRRIKDYSDYIDFKNKKIVRRIRERILDGTAITKVNRTSGGVCYGTASNACPYCSQTRTLIKNTHFQLLGATIKLGGSYTVNQSLLMTHTNQEINTVELWNEWLQEQYDNGTPVKVNYVLKMPIEEPIDIKLPKLTAKTSIIEVDTSVSPSNMSGKYILK